MNRKRTLGQYRAVDIFLWCLMLSVFETIILTAALRWFPGQPYVVSLVPVITSVLLVRWGAFAAFPAALGGVLVCLLSGAKPSQYAVYAVGNLLSLLLVPALSPLRKEGVFRSSLQCLIFGLMTLLLMQAGRSLVSLLFGSGPALAFGFFTTDVITDLFTLVILWIVRRLDGVLEDQKHYLNRIRSEELSGR